jgi:hypothetical protein
MTTVRAKPAHKAHQTIWAGDSRGLAAGGVEGEALRKKTNPTLVTSDGPIGAATTELGPSYLRI